MFSRLAADFLKVDYLFLAVGVVGGACSDVEQHIIQVTKYSKREQLLELLKTTGDRNLTYSCHIAVTDWKQLTKLLIGSVLLLWFFSMPIIDIILSVVILHE